MRCPNCGSFEDKVVESRTLALGGCIRRRRECAECGYRFTSYEKIEEKPFMVIKKDGRREPFDAKKLERGIERALEKRPFSIDMIENTVNELESEAMIKAGSSKEIPSSELGEMVLNRLYGMDKVAYVRFASVYKHFDNLEEFIQEIKKAKKAGVNNGKNE